MGYNARSDEIHDNIVRMQREWEAGTVVDLDLRMKPRDPEASVRVALREVRCPRCNGHGHPRIVALARHPSI